MSEIRETLQKIMKINESGDHKSSPLEALQGELAVIETMAEGINSSISNQDANLQREMFDLIKKIRGAIELSYKMDHNDV
tara:strand:- start:91 stop:330 length:240 start_codon:yes stop_codon:yes gene_type:complete